MEQFYKDFGFIIGFLVCVLVIQMSFGDKVARGFIVLVLLSMLILNYEKMGNFISGIFTLKE